VRSARLRPPRAETDTLLCVALEVDVGVAIRKSCGAAPAVYIGTDHKTVFRMLSAPGYSASCVALPSMSGPVLTDTRAEQARPKRWCWKIGLPWLSTCVSMRR
jgi:hypothetical protein